MSRQPRIQARYRRAASLCALLLFTLLLGSGCATAEHTQPRASFDFSRDTLAFPNQMHWVYEFDQAGNWHTRHRDPPPTFALRCFPLVRATREFAYHARFAPDEPRQDEAFYDAAVRAVIARSSQQISPDEERVVFPGFASLKEFSAAYPGLLKAHCGSAVSSYLQRGNWRVVFPFFRRGQANTARALEEKLARGELPIIHLTEFPMLNHGVLVYGVRREPGVVYFDTYDPNTPETPVVLRYYPPNRTFVLPYTPYFYGGEVNIYEVFNGWLY